MADIWYDESNENTLVTNENLHQDTQRIMDEQDQGIEIISAALKRTKQIGEAIGQEVDDQNHLLNDITRKVDKTNDRIVNGTTRIENDDEGDVQTSAISKCRNLSATDKSEVGLLRSRVEEQSHLIMTIKTRADEEYERRKHLQELLDASEERNSELITETCTLKKRFSDLSERFDILATNHEEMIKFKNEYKEECDRLTKLSNESHIKKRISNAVSPLEERISQLQNEVNKLESDCVNSDYTIRKLEQDHLNNESTWKKERTSYDRQIESLNTSLDRALTELKELSERRLRELNASKIEITSLRSEKDKYFQLALDRGKIVEEKQIQINLLSSKVNKLEADLKLSLAKFQSNAAAVDANENVKQSRQRADEAEHKFSELKKEYDAFVLHSRSELKKQTDQNKRLRHMLGN